MSVKGSSVFRDRSRAVKDTDKSHTPSFVGVEDDLFQLRNLQNHFTSLSCRDCKSSLSFGDVQDHFTTWLATATGSSSAPISSIYCKRCKKYTCIGCRKKPSLDTKTISTPVAQVKHCCSKGRLFGIWILLARFDEIDVELGRRMGLYKLKEESQCQPGDGLGYNQNVEFLPPSWWPKSKSKFVESNQDSHPAFIQTFQLLPSFVPSSQAKDNFDKDPPAAVCAIFRLSFILDDVAALLRNDSIVDMTEKSMLYHAMLGLVSAIASHKKLLPLLILPRFSLELSPGLQALGTHESFVKLFDTTPSNLGSPLISWATESYKHAKAYRGLDSNAAIARGTQNKQSKKSMALCEEIIAFYRAVRKAAPEALQDPKPHDKDAWTVYAKSCQVTFTDAVLSPHMCSEKFKKITHSPRGRMAALRKEIASLTTSLPVGIFLKISETRPDVMKLLIVGADDTPYEGGLFAFDLCLPEKWPAVPPVLYFAIYMGFDGPNDPCNQLNPNIHADGKICLSLLNTWNGNVDELWQPNKSTLLSVFVSIQGMILGVKIPLDNAIWRTPFSDIDRKTNAESARSIAIAYSILWWIVDDKANKSAWRKISAMYFKCKGNQLMEMAEKLAPHDSFLKQYLEYVTALHCWKQGLDCPPQHIDLMSILNHYLQSGGQ